jgi:hypothetical protein
MPFLNYLAKKALNHWRHVISEVEKGASSAVFPRNEKAFIKTHVKTTNVRILHWLSMDMNV